MGFSSQLMPLLKSDENKLADFCIQTEIYISLIFFSIYYYLIVKVTDY